ncbi:hypothetical protein STEG23_008945, partial [Scotinomys teguina]
SRTAAHRMVQSTCRVILSLRLSSLKVPYRCVQRRVSMVISNPVKFLSKVRLGPAVLQESSMSACHIETVETSSTVDYYQLLSLSSTTHSLLTTRTTS